MFEFILTFRGIALRFAYAHFYVIISSINRNFGGHIMWKNIYVEGAVGSENGLILEDEEYQFYEDFTCKF